MKLIIAVAATLLYAAPASAQRILDWPLRTTAGPEAVTRGVEAAFWNPAALMVASGRGEAIIADQRTPDAIGLGGFAAAAAWRLDPRTTVAAGYQHVAIDDIGETSTSPIPETGELKFAIVEDQVALSAAHALGAALTAGVGVRYSRSDEWGADSSTTSLTAGFILNPALPFSPVAGVSVITQPGGVRYAGGLDVAVPTLLKDLSVRIGYGLRGGEDQTTEHRFGFTSLYRSTLGITAGLGGANAGGGSSWQPVLGASVRVNRYELGVMRENLSYGFGAAYSFRFRIGLK